MTLQRTWNLQEESKELVTVWMEGIQEILAKAGMKVEQEQPQGAAPGVAATSAVPAPTPATRRYSVVRRTAKY